MSVLVDLAGLSTALDLVTLSAIFFKLPEGDIIPPDISGYTKAEVDLKLGDLELKKLDREEYDKTLEEVLRATGYKDIEEFSEEKTYYLGDLVKVRTVDSEDNIIWTYYRYTKVHTPSLFITSDCVLTNLYLEILSLKLLDVETVYLHISTEKGGITLSDYHITYKYDELIYYADISSNGECLFSVPKGKHYILIFPLFEGYTPKESMYLYASINTKSLYINYTVLKLEVETVTVKGLVYDSSGKEADNATKTLVLENAEFTLVIDGETKEVKKFDSLSLVLYFNVPIGSSYMIKCNSISQYVSPPTTVRELADLSTKRFEFVFTYIGSDSGWIAISKSGKLYNLDTISGYRDDELKSLNIVALRFSNSVLTPDTEEYRAAFWIPLLYVYNGSWRPMNNYLTNNYYKSNIGLDSTKLPYCNRTSITKLNGYYPSIDGYENTERLRFLASRSTYSNSVYWKEFTKILRSEDTESDFPSIIESLTCGDTAYWAIENNSLYIMGEGGIWSYDTFDLTPWSSYNGRISGIYIGPKITSLGNNCFSGFTSGGELEITKVVCFADIIPLVSETTFATYIYLGTLYIPDSTFTILDSGIINICDLSSLPIDGYKCIPFIPAINQLLLLRPNYKVLLNFFKKWYKAHYGIADYTLTYLYSGSFWSSTLHDATNSWVLLASGAPVYYNKTNKYNVVPYFDITPLAVTSS